MKQNSRKWFLIVTISVLSLFATNASAQSSLVGRLFFVHYGNLYSWGVGDTEPTLHTTGAVFYIMNPTLSPDNTHLAFRMISPQAWNSSYYEVGNIWLWDLQTDTMNPITTNADFVTDQDNVVSRSAPTWSPDGTQIAWTEWGVAHLAIMVYDLETGEIRMHSDEVNFGFSDAGEYQDQAVHWGRYISKDVFSFFEDGGAGMLLSIYGDEGQRCQHQLDSYERDENSNSPEIPGLHDIQWVEFNSEWWLGLQYEDQLYRLMNPDTDEQWETDQSPVLRLQDDTANEAVENQRAMLADNPDVPERALWESSPEGQYLASEPAGTSSARFAVWHDGEAVFEYASRSIPDRNFYFTSGFEWSVETWQLPDDTEITPVEPFIDIRSGDCPPSG